MIPTLDIIIVNRNSGNYLYDCLASINVADKTDFSLLRVCVVDDASTDGSLSQPEYINFPIQIIRNANHRGYGASCNRAAEGSKADYLLFLNTDTCLTAHSLTGPMLYMEQPENMREAIVGIKLLDKSGEVSRSCARFPTVGQYFVMMFGLDRLFPSVFRSHLMKDWDHLNAQEVDQVIGAFMLMRRSVFEKLGGYDERFFVYMEDLDLSLRACQMGMKSKYLNVPYAYHMGGGTSKKVRAESLFFNLRSRIQYGFKHFSLAGAIFLALGTIFIEPLMRLAFSVTRRSMVDLKTTLHAYAKLWHWFFSLMITRIS